MAINKRIATLSAALVADISGYERDMNKAAATTRSTEGKISASMSKLEKVGLKFGLGLVGGGGALAMLTNEIRHVIDNIEKIPGVPASTIASVQQTRYAFAQSRTTIDQAIAGVVSFTAWSARAAGFAGGALVYGLDNAENAYWEFGRAAEAAATAQERQAAAAKKAKEETEAAARVIAYARGLEDKAIADGAAAMAANAKAKEAYDRRDETQAQRMIRLRGEANATFNQAGTGGSAADITARVNDQAKAYEKLSESAKIEKELTEVAREHMQVWGETFEMINDSGYAEAMENNRRYADEAKDASVHFASSLSNAFEESIIQGKELGDVIGDLGRSIMSTFLKLSVVNPLMNSIFGGAKGWDLLPTFGGFFAEGGTLAPGKWGIAGENGPEPIFGGSSGMTVIPNKAAKGGAGGNTYIIDARGADRAGLAELYGLIRQLDGSIEERAVAATFAAGGRTLAHA
jgi:hypothetical protein